MSNAEYIEYWKVCSTDELLKEVNENLQMFGDHYYWDDFLEHLSAQFDLLVEGKRHV